MQSANGRELLSAGSSGSLSDPGSPDHLAYSDNSSQEECIIQEIDRGISFPAPCGPSQLQQPVNELNELKETVPEIKLESTKTVPCNVKQSRVSQVKREETVRTQRQCAILANGPVLQRNDQKPVITKIVQNVKLPLPRDAKQEPIFVQPLNGNIPIQTVLPVTTTQPQMQTVNLISNAQGSVLKPGNLQWKYFVFILWMIFNHDQENCMKNGPITSVYLYLMS